MAHIKVLAKDPCPVSFREILEVAHTGPVRTLAFVAVHGGPAVWSFREKETQEVACKQRESLVAESRPAVCALASSRSK